MKQRTEREIIEGTLAEFANEYREASMFSLDLRMERRAHTDAGAKNFIYHAVSDELQRRAYLEFYEAAKREVEEEHVGL